MLGDNNGSDEDELGIFERTGEGLDLIDEGRANPPGENEEVRLDDSEFMVETKAFDEWTEEDIF